MLRFALPCLLLSACQCATLPDGARFMCGPGAPCSAGFVCVNELCQPAGAGGGAAGSGEGGGTGGGAAAGGMGGGGISRSFTWENPTPFGHAINAMASRGAELLAVGDYGLVLHFDGLTWRREDAATTADLRAVAYASTADALVVAENGLLLKRAPAGAWSAVSGRDAGEHRAVAWSEAKGQFIIGGDGVATMHTLGIGGALQPLDGPVSPDLTVRSIDSSLGLVTEAAIFRYDAGGWSEERRQPGDDFFAIDGRWAAGFSSTSGNGQVVERDDAGAWSLVPFANSPGRRYRALAVTTDGGCLAVGEEGLAYSCSEQQRPDFTPYPDLDVYAVTGEGYVAGRAAVVSRYGGDKGWTLLDVGVRGEQCDRLNAIAGSSATNVWAGGTRSVALQRKGDAGWSSVGASGLPSTIRAVAAASNGDIWLVGNQGQVKVFFADGGQEAAGLDPGPLTAVAATPDYAWVGGTGGFIAYRQLDGGTWTPPVTFTATTWTGIATRGSGSPDETFFVGGELFRRMGGGMVRQRVGASLNDIWISPSEEIFIAGAEADGGALLLSTLVSAPETLRTVDVSCARGPFVAIHGTSLTDLWLVESGARRSVVHFTGQACERIAVPHSAALTDVFATPTDVWLTGRDCAVLHLAR